MLDQEREMEQRMEKKRKEFKREEENRHQLESDNIKHKYKSKL